MKVISFFSRLAVICNISFLLFIFFGWMEARKPAQQSPDIVTAVSFFKDIIITLGVASFIINIIMCLVYLVTLVIGKHTFIPKRLAIINISFLEIQFAYYFIR